MAWKVLMTAMPMGVVGQAAVEQLRLAGCQVLDVARQGPIPEADLVPLLKGIDAIIAGMDPYNARVLATPESAQLKIISRWGVGFDAVDLAAATKHGVIVANTPGLLNEAVADYTFALLLALARRVHEGHLIMRQGGWKATWGGDVAGKTLGILGCGRIGQAVAKRASGFNLRVIAHDLAPHPDAQKAGIQFVSLQELFAQSDFLCLHAALTPENRGLIGEALLKSMRRTAYLINTARGALIDEAALVRALKEGWIAGAALDAFIVEPLPAEHPLRTAPNVLLTPHQASYGFDTGAAVSHAAAKSVLDAMEGRQPFSVVNPDVIDSPQLRHKVA